MIKKICPLHFFRCTQIVGLTPALKISVGDTDNVFFDEI